MKMKVGFSLEEVTVKRIEKMADATRRNYSAIVDIAIELLAAQEEFAQFELEPAAPTPRQAPRNPDQVPGVRKGAH